MAAGAALVTGACDSIGRTSVLAVIKTLLPAACCLLPSAAPVSSLVADQRWPRRRRASHECDRLRPRDWKRGEPIALLEGAPTAEAIMFASGATIAVPGVARPEAQTSRYRDVAERSPSP